MVVVGWNSGGGAVDGKSNRGSYFRGIGERGARGFRRSSVS